MCSLIRLFVSLRSIRPERNVAVSDQVCKITKNREKITPQPAAFEDRNPSFILLTCDGEKGKEIADLCVPRVDNYRPLDLWHATSRA